MALPYDTDALIKQTQQMLAQTKAEGSKAFAGSSFDTALPTISTASLTPKTPLNFQSPQVPPPPTVQAPTQTAEDIINQLYGTPSRNEGQITDLQRSIAELTGQQAQETSRRAQLEGTPELEAKRQQVQQLLSRANALAAEQQAIPLQIQQDIQAGGANVTKGGIAPIQTAALRNNAIQALSTGALLSAAQGDLTNALSQVDRAVAAEFEPIKAQLAAQRANLEMLMNDPTSTREEKRRAAIAEVRLTEMEKEEAKREENKKSIHALALQAQGNGADNVIVDMILQSTSLEDAIRNAQGFTAKETLASIQEYNFAVKNGYKGSFVQYQNEDANRKVSIAKAGVANTFGLTPNQVFQATQKIKASVATNTEAARELQRQSSILTSTWNRLESGAAKDLNGTSQAIITTFNKLLDPTSVVREAEYDRSASGQALISTIQGKIAAIQQGGPGLTKQSLKELVDLGNLYASNAQKSIDAANQRAREEAEYFGLNPDFVISPGVSMGGVAPISQQSALSTEIQQKISNAIEIQGTTAYLPRSVWDSLGAGKDAVLAEAKADGYTLLIK